MSKRKHRPAKPLPKSAAEIQKHNLAFAEKFGEEMPSVNDVPVVKALSFDLVQYLNFMAKESVDQK